MTKYLREEADVETLDLDLNNPRIHEKGTQTQAMAAVLRVELEGEKVYALAEKICEMEGLDPGDALYVIASKTHPGRYIVLDGNRRLTALRLLSGAATMDFSGLGLGSGLASRFKKLALNAADKWPSRVDIVTFPDKETARPWIRLRHTGENSGAGRSSWNALQIDIFDNNGSWLAVKDLWEASSLSSLVINQLQNHSFEITTLERFIRTRAASGLFGFSIKDNGVDWGDNPKLAKRAVTRLADDVAIGKITSRTHEKTAAIEELLKTLHTELTAPPAPVEPAPGEGRDTPPPYKPGNEDGDRSSDDIDRSGFGKTSGAQKTSPTDDGKGQPSESPSGEPSPPKPPRQARKKSRLIQRDEFRWVIDPKCMAIVRELREELKYAEVPYACALLARTLLELTAYHYLIAFELPIPSDNKTDNIKRAGEHLRDNTLPNDPRDKRSIAKALIDRTESYAPLSQAAHSPSVHWEAGHVFAVWETISPAMELMWQRITSRQQQSEDAGGQPREVQT